MTWLPGQNRAYQVLLRGVAKESPRKMKTKALPPNHSSNPIQKPTIHWLTTNIPSHTGQETPVNMIHAAKHRRSPRSEEHAQCVAWTGAWDSERLRQLSYLIPCAMSRTPSRNPIAPNRERTNSNRNPIEARERRCPRNQSITLMQQSESRVQDEEKEEQEAIGSRQGKTRSTQHLPNGNSDRTRKTRISKWNLQIKRPRSHSKINKNHLSWRTPT